MMSDPVLEWLLEWFKKRGADDKKLSRNGEVSYLELGLIDSMGLVELIAAIEERFGVRFDETHFQDPRFVTLDGLAELTAQLHRKP